MLSGLSDTDPEVVRLHTQLLRQATRAQRLEVALSLSAAVIALARSGIRRRSPALSEVDARLRFVEIHYGPELARAIRIRLSRSSLT